MRDKQIEAWCMELRITEHFSLTDTYVDNAAVHWGYYIRLLGSVFYGFKHQNHSKLDLVMHTEKSSFLPFERKCRVLLLSFGLFPKI